MMLTTTVVGLPCLQAQSVGPGGVPGTNSNFVCKAGNNCAALNAANTFAAAQTFNGDIALETPSTTSPSPLISFPGGDKAEIGWAWNPGVLYIQQGSAPTVQFYEGNGNTQGIFITSWTGGTGGCFGWAPAPGFSIGATPDALLCQPAQNVFSFGSTKNGADGMILASAIGSGTSTNTDLRGHLTLSSGTATYTFVKSYTIAPTCVASDTTTTAAVKVSATITTLTLTGTGSDTLNYICAD